MSKRAAAPLSYAASLVVEPLAPPKPAGPPAPKVAEEAVGPGQGS
jgi:hypothetical protein